MTSIFIVRGEYRGGPESYIYGVYPTVALALARVQAIEDQYDEDAWYDEVKVGPNGADCEISNQ